MISYLHFSGSADALFDSITEIKSLPAGNVILLVMKPNPGSSSTSSTTQPSPQSTDDNKDDDDDDDDDNDDDDDDGDDAMDQASQPDIDKIDDSNPGNSPTHSEVQMIEITTAATQNNNDYQELPEESNACKRPASLTKRKSRSSKKQC